MANVQMVLVASSNVKAIGYDAPAQELHVDFHSGHSGIYANVPAAKQAALMAAPSKGSHLHANFIKQGKTHPYRRK